MPAVLDQLLGSASVAAGSEVSIGTAHDALAELIVAFGVVTDDVPAFAPVFSDANTDAYSIAEKTSVRGVAQKPVAIGYTVPGARLAAGSALNFQPAGGSAYGGTDLLGLVAASFKNVTPRPYAQNEGLGTSGSAVATSAPVSAGDLVAFVWDETSPGMPLLGAPWHLLASLTGGGHPLMAAYYQVPAATGIVNFQIPVLTGGGGGQFQWAISAFRSRGSSGRMMM